MGIEIERKFLLRDASWRNEIENEVMVSQGYLGSSGLTTVRVRLADKQGFLTIKGPTRGLTRAEFEYPIPSADAQELLELCENNVLRKRRFQIRRGQDMWEIDEFLDANAGLIVAEIELQDEQQDFERPSWLGDEVTFDIRFRNTNLCASPYSSWQS